MDLHTFGFVYFCIPWICILKFCINAQKLIHSSYNSQIISFHFLVKKLENP